MKKSYESYTNDVYDEMSEVLNLIKRNGVNKNLSPELKHLAAQLPIVLENLRNSVTFRLPENGLLFDEYTESSKKRLSTFVEKINLPYPVCAIEFDLTGEIKGIPLLKKESYKFCMILIDNDDHVSIYDFIDDRTNKGMMIFSFDALRLDKKCFDFYDNTDSYGACRSSVNREKVIVDFICALSCGNVEITESDINPSTVIQKIRKNKGKIPLFVHKILQLNNKRVTKDRVLVKNGTHSSPAVHLRRGHIRRLPKKNIWVNACVVGNASNGTIIKDYKVT